MTLHWHPAPGTRPSPSADNRHTPTRQHPEELGHMDLKKPGQTPPVADTGSWTRPSWARPRAGTPDPGAGCSFLSQIDDTATRLAQSEILNEEKRRCVPDSGGGHTASSSATAHGEGSHDRQQVGSPVEAVQHSPDLRATLRRASPRGSHPTHGAPGWLDTWDGCMKIITTGPQLPHRGEPLLSCSQPHGTGHLTVRARGDPGMFHVKRLSFPLTSGPPLAQIPSALPSPTSQNLRSTSRGGLSTPSLSPGRPCRSPVQTILPKRRMPQGIEKDRSPQSQYAEAPLVRPGFKGGEEIGKGILRPPPSTPMSASSAL